MRKLALPLKTVIIGKLLSKHHPSVKHGGTSDSYGLFAGEFIRKGDRIGYYAGCLLTSEEMDRQADQRQDGRYAVDFPLPPSVEPINDRDSLVVDASTDRCVIA